MLLSGFWHAAAALSGRIDLSEARRQPDSISAMSDRALALCGVRPRHIARLRQAPPLQLHDHRLTLEDASYPGRLAALPYAPPVLFYRGNVERLRDPCVAVVGARRCTQRARDLAGAFSRDLSAAGVSVVSGLAYGVDEAAHNSAPGQTIAILGQGLAADLSGRQRRLIDTILSAGGLVLSEFLPHFPASRYTFPMRNRVISGLTLGTVVVEASLRSGSLVTARHALDQGREVMAVPGHPLDSMSTGCNRLIADGAVLVTGSDDILSAIDLPPSTRRPSRPACAHQRAVLNALRTGDTVDHVSAVTGLDIPTMMVAIDALELTGHVARLPGDRLRT